MKTTSLKTVGWTIIGLVVVAGASFRCLQADSTQSALPEAPAKGNEAEAKAPGGADAKPSSPDKFVLLNNDRVLRGQIFSRDGQIEVRRGGIRIFHKENDVAFIGDSMTELYEYKTKQVPENDFPERLKIKKWCVENKMKEQALLEVHKILKLDPENADAKTSLRFLERELPYVGHDIEGSPDTIPLDTQKFIKSIRDGHGDEFVDHFAARADNILMSRCAHCHNSVKYSGAFKLYRRSNDRRDQRVIALNLRSALEAIDRDNPQNSPLLYMAVTPHGKSQLSALGGVNDPKYKELRDWVFHYTETYSHETDLKSKEEILSASRKSNAKGLLARPREGGGRPTKAGNLAGDAPAPRPGLGIAADDAPEPDMSSAKIRSSRPNPKGTPKTPIAKSTNSASVDKAVPEEPKVNEADPFDPANFNVGVRPKLEKKKSAEKNDAEADEKPAARDE